MGISGITDSFMQDALKRVYRRAYHSQAQKALEMALKPSRSTYKQYLTKGLALGSAGGLGLLVANAVLGGAGKLAESYSNPVAFKKMLSHNPDLTKGDMAKTKQIFDTFYQASPSMAKAPLVAGSMVRRAMEYGDVGIDAKTIAEMAKTESYIKKNKIGDISSLTGIGKLLL